jgi:hypothetical protein
MPIAPLDILVHASNILLLVAYSVRDILWLRWFAVAAALTNIPFFLLQETILWPPVMWAGVFTAINLAQIWRIYMQRRPVKLTGDEQRLYALGFDSIRPRDFLSLTMLGSWEDAAEGKRMLEAGKPAEEVCIAVDGTVVMTRGEERVGELAPGQLIGVTMVLIGEPSPVDARFATRGRYIRWPLGRLRAFLDAKPDLRAAVLAHVKQDIARKLYGQATRAPA